MDDSFIMLIFTVMVLIFLIWRVVVDVNPSARLDDTLSKSLANMESGLDVYFSSPTAMNVPTTSSVGGLQDWWNTTTSGWSSGGASAKTATSVLPTSSVTSYKLLTLNTIPKGALKTAQKGATIVTTGIICPANYTFDAVSKSCKGSSGDSVQGTCPAGTVIIDDKSATTRCVFGCSEDTDAVAVEGEGVSCYKIPIDVLSKVGSDTCPTCQPPPPPPRVLYRSWNTGWAKKEEDDEGLFCPSAYPNSNPMNQDTCMVEGASPAETLKPICASGSHLELAKGLNNKTIYYCAKQDPLTKEVIPAPESQSCPPVSLSFGGEFLFDTVPTKDHPDRVAVEVNQCKTCSEKYEKISNDGSLCLLAETDAVGNPKKRMLKMTWNRLPTNSAAIKGATQSVSMSDKECQNKCINEPGCVASAMSQWGQCTTYISIGSELNWDCCSGTRLVG